MHSYYRVISIIICLVSFITLPLQSASPAQEEARALDSLASSYPAETDIQLGRLALIIARTVYPSVNPEKYLNRLDEMAEEIGHGLGKHPRPKKVIRAINEYLFRTKGFKAMPVGKGDSPDKFMLNKVMDARRGNCLGLCTLYLALAERLNLTLYAVVIPQHVFLVYDDGRTKLNIEPTSNGNSVSHKEYIKQTRELIGDIIRRHTIGQDIKFRRIRKRAFIGLILFNRGVAYSRQGKNTAAIKDFTRTIALDSNYPEAYKGRGSAYLNTEEYARAASDFTKAVSIETNCPSSFYSLGTALGHLNQLDAAIKYYSRALELAPDYTDVYQNRGVAYSMKKDYNKALADFNLALKADPKHAATYYNRGLIYMNKNQHRKALADFTRTIQFDPDYVEAYNNRGTIYAQQKKWAEAINDFEKILSIDPDYASAYKNLGITYYNIERYNDAFHYLSTYLEHIPQNAPDRKEINDLLKDIKSRVK